MSKYIIEIPDKLYKTVKAYKVSGGSIASWRILEAVANGIPLSNEISQGWIPIKTEKISETEKKELAERYDMRPEDFDDYWRYACKMPEDNQECLITTSVWGYVCIDTFHIDEDGSMYFEEHEDEDDVLAWMPLPKPYTKEDADT